MTLHLVKMDTVEACYVRHIVVAVDIILGACGPLVISLGAASLGGGGGHPVNDNENAGHAWFKDVAGSGGKSGSGGNIFFEEKSKIYAFNGSQLTDANFEETLKMFDVNGLETSEVLPKITKPNGLEIIPSIIFAQNGIIRKTYTTNQSNWTLSKILDCNRDIQVATCFNEVRFVDASSEKHIDKIEYSNGYMPNQGIGSRSSAILNLQMEHFYQLVI